MLAGMMSGGVVLALISCAFAMHEQGSSRSREKGEARAERQQPSRDEPDHTSILTLSSPEDHPLAPIPIVIGRP
jgi:hypothetical protein